MIRLPRKRKKKEKAKKREQQAEETHNLRMSILVVVRLSYLFCDSCIR